MSISALNVFDGACRLAARRIQHVLGYGSTVVNVGARVSEVTDEYVLRVGANRVWHVAYVAHEEVEAVAIDNVISLVDVGCDRLVAEAARWHGGVGCRNLAAAYRPAHGVPR